MNVSPDFYVAASAFTGALFAVGAVTSGAGWWLNSKFSHVYRRMDESDRAVNKSMNEMDKNFTASMVAHEAKDVDRFNSLKTDILNVNIQKQASEVKGKLP